MGWRTVVINTHSKLTYANNHLVFKNAQQTEKIHLSEIDILILETTDITTMLLKRLTDEKILVIFCDDKRLPSSQLFSYYGRHDSSLQLSKQIQWESDLKSVVWTTIIAQKIHNQCRFLQENDFVEKASALSKLSEELETFEEAGACGTAAVISPVGQIDDLENNKSIHFGKPGEPGEWCTKLYNRLRAIQYGDEPDKFGWITIVE